MAPAVEVEVEVAAVVILVVMPVVSCWFRWVCWRVCAWAVEVVWAEGACSGRYHSEPSVCINTLRCADRLAVTAWPGTFSKQKG